MARTKSGRSQRRVLQATLVASVFGAAPSLLYGVRRDGVRGTWRYGVGATRALATLVPPGRPNLIVGGAAHFTISAAFGQLLGRFLPVRRSALWGAACGAVMGLVGAGVVGRRSAAFRELPFGRQLADNIAFGAIFAVVADRAGGELPDRREADPGPIRSIEAKATLRAVAGS